jgi:hypothetical protein
MAEEWDANITREQAAGDIEEPEATGGAEDALTSGAHGDEHTIEESSANESAPVVEDEPADVASELPEADEETAEVSPGYTPEPAAEPSTPENPPAPPEDAVDGANSQSA